MKKSQKVLITYSLTLFFIVLGFQNCSIMSALEENEGPGLSTSLSSNSYEFRLNETGMQKLSRQQIVDSLTQLFEISVVDFVDLLPEDTPSATYFDSDYKSVSFSLATIESYNQFASSLSLALKTDQTWFGKLMNCVPVAPDDADCFKKFLQKVGARILRRPLEDSEIQKFTDMMLPFAIEDDDFYVAVQYSLEGLFQHPEFIYRVEYDDLISNDPGAIDAISVASRMSFFIWGAAPDQILLEAAVNGDLSTSDGRKEQADRMLSDPRAIENTKRFHSQWLGYKDRFIPDTISADARLETDKLIEKITSSADLNWLELLNSDETFVTPNLAGHYGGLSQVTNQSGEWVIYPDDGRGGGILSHATIASLGAKFDDTSPTLRGYELFKRLFCGELEGEIPPGVDVDFAPGGPNDCKEQSYTMRSVAVCAQCHNTTDNLGFGLENLGAYGEWRVAEPSKPQCQISGSGSYENQSFVGPKQLGKILINNPRVSRCASQQLFEYFVGRKSTEKDEESILALQEEYLKDGKYKAMVKAIVGSEAIRFRF